MFSFTILLAIYFLPFIIAAGNPRGPMIFVINLFLGWTLIGWVIALAMAVAPKGENHAIRN